MSGKIISCWSKAGHQNGVTTGTALISLLLSQKLKDKKILTFDVNTVYTELEELLSCKNPQTICLDNLNNASELDSLSRNNLCKCCVEVTGNLYNINAAKSPLFEDFKIGATEIEKILKVAQGVFDIIIVDSSSGSNELSNTINEMSDVVVNFLQQNTLRLEFMESLNVLNELRGEKYINILNHYSEEKGISVADMKREYGITVLPLNHIKDIAFSFNCKNFKNLSYDNLPQVLSIAKKICKLISIEFSESNLKKKSFFNLFGGKKNE